jgi:flavin reductase (DIM6/NTAB) family NADH-FMN oxidoreductase RutF
MSSRAGADAAVAPGRFRARRVSAGWRRPDGAALRALMGLAPSPVVVVTGRAADGAPLGLTVGSFVSVSLEPQLALISVARGSGTWARIARSGHFAVNLLGDDAEWLARRFAGPGERFRGVAHGPGPRRLPILHDAAAAAAFELVDRHRAGDHEIAVGKLIAARLQTPQPPLVHHRGGYATVTPLAAAG